MFLKDKNMENDPYEQPKPKNLAYTIVGSVHISTGIWHTSIPAAGGWVKTFETFVWADVSGKRGELLKCYYHNTEIQAMNFHATFQRRLRLKMK